MHPTSTSPYRLCDENSKPNYQKIQVEEMKVTVTGQQDWETERGGATVLGVVKLLSSSVNQ